MNRKQRIKKWMAIFTVFVLVFQIGNGSVFAESISGDKGNMSISSDTTYLYFTYEGTWSSYLSERIQVAADGTSLGSLAAVSLSASNEKDSGKITVTDAWGSAISGASGSVTNTDKKDSYGYKNMKWSVKVPISAYNSFDITNMTFTWGGKSVTLAVKEEITTEATTEEGTTEKKSEEVTTEEDTTEKTTEKTTEETSAETSEETTTENGKTEESVTTEAETTTGTEATTETGSSEELTTETGSTEENTSTEAVTETTEATTEEDFGNVVTEIEENLTVSGNVQMDGLYDDWDDIPSTEIEYNEYTKNYGQMFTDGEYIYAHFKMSNRYTDALNLGLWYLDINGKRYTIRIKPAKNGQIDYSTPDPYKAGTYTNLKVFFEYGSNTECDSNVVYTIYDTSHGSEKPGDDIEFSFSLEKLSQYTGIPIDQMGTITLSNPNLGSEGITLAGSSTGPLVGITVAFLIALAFFKKEKEMRNV